MIRVRYNLKVEYAERRRIRERNTRRYRLAHWPIWIWVFFLAPGPLTFNLFAHGGSRANLLWLFAVVAATGVAGHFGQLPGAEPRPYILRFSEDKPNPLYRKICYTFAWNALVNFTLLNLAGLIVAAASGRWILHQIYLRVYAPLGAAILLAGAAGLWPRVRSSTKGEGFERRYFYGAVWSAAIAQSVLLLLWKTLPETQAGDAIKLAVFVLCLLLAGAAAAMGKLPRTRPIVPGTVLVGE